MEDVVEALQLAAEEVPVPLELPEFEQLVDVEEQILMPLPHAYKEFLLSVSDLVIGSMEPATVADPNSHTYLAELTATAWEQGLSRELIPICEHHGRFYCINQEGEISLWPDEEDSDENQWDSIWHWARDVWLVS